MIKQISVTENEHKYEVADINTIDTNTKSDYSKWIKEPFRIFQMVDRAVTPIIVNKGKKSLVIFPSVSLGKTDRIIKVGDEYAIQSKDKTLSNCVTISISNKKAGVLRKVILNRLSQNFDTDSHGAIELYTLILARVK